MLCIVTVALLVLVALKDAEAGTPPISDSCRHWCPRAGYPPGEAFYCCDRGIGTIGDEFDSHPGKCPDRPFCPKNEYLRIGPRPTVCAHDGQCKRHEKCCTDACLNHHTCLIADPH
ncbi:waprin-Phi1-like [Portunus trituberculatus]|uniref:waprin-Phi1-like n=1 Tax=Portunus trituberculatus TaxID=210409 RepID=UPI001E1D119B|nr:waprin-Phi1-like [Portunus trituberculatus]